MSISATLRSANAINVQVRTQNTMQAKALQVGHNPKLTTLPDVDSSQLAEGAVLIYNATAQKFETKSEMDNSSTIVNGGNY